jgi:hypothetical protein
MEGVTIKPDGHRRLLVTFPCSPARVQAMDCIRSPLDKLNLSSGKRTAEEMWIDDTKVTGIHRG